jgi:hypothetical protein
MSEEVKKLTAEELQQVRILKQEYTNLSVNLGELILQKANIEEDIKILLESRKFIYEKEQKIAKDLQEKYGQGSINIDTGEVKP